VDDYRAVRDVLRRIVRIRPPEAAGEANMPPVRAAAH
jgi:hypothetical protein